MRRSARFLMVFLFFFCFCLLSLPRPVFAAQDLIILPDPSSPEYDTVFQYEYETEEETEDETEDETKETSDPETVMDSAGSAGTDAVLVIDVSGSMKQSDPEYFCRRAAMNFIDELSARPGSRAALVTFSDTIQKVIPLTGIDALSDDQELILELNRLSYTAGDTDIGSAMEKAVSLLTEDVENARARSIFLLTDGEIDLPAAPNEEAAEKESLTRALMAVEDAKEEGIVIHTVALDLSGHIDTNLLNYMADSTGGTSNVVNNASALNRVFRQLSEYAAKMLPETESFPEPETEETEEMTETETEEQAVPVMLTIGSIDSPVRLDGLLPGLCSASVRLSDLFCLDGAAGGFDDSIRYTAYPDDQSVLSCQVEGDMLLISGLKNGSTQMQVIAEPAFYDGRADLSFLVEIDALIPSERYLILIPAALAVVVVIVLLIRRRRTPSCRLSGSLQWFVRGENEKIFGMPSQTMADLKDYGSSVRLSELIQDELLDGADLKKVVIRAQPDGILITSRSSSCMIAVPGSQPLSRIAMSRSGRFRVLCETAGGRAVVIAYYTAREPYKTEPSFEDDSEERTRLLV